MERKNRAKKYRNKVLNNETVNFVRVFEKTTQENLLEEREKTEKGTEIAKNLGKFKDTKANFQFFCLKIEIEDPKSLNTLQGLLSEPYPPNSPQFTR